MPFVSLYLLISSDLSINLVVGERGTVHVNDNLSRSQLLYT